MNLNSVEENHEVRHWADDRDTMNRQCNGFPIVSWQNRQCRQRLVQLIRRRDFSADLGQKKLPQGIRENEPKEWKYVRVVFISGVFLFSRYPRSQLITIMQLRGSFGAVTGSFILPK